MFVPFQTLNDFYPGLFLWTDPTLYGRTVASALGAAGDRRLTSRDLRPCLVVGVDTANLTFTAAPLSATRPCNTEGWVRIDDVTPCITWKLNDAWIWVGTPPTLSMVFYEPKIMHPNKDMYYSVDPIASANLKSYWIQRKAYRRQSPTKGMESYSSYSTPTSSPSRSSASSSSPSSACFSPGPAPLHALPTRIHLRTLLPNPKASRPGLGQPHDRNTDPGAGVSLPAGHCGGGGASLRPLWGGDVVRVRRGRSPGLHRVLSRVPWLVARPALGLVLERRHGPGGPRVHVHVDAWASLKAMSLLASV
ncbi:hypothetical protein MKEN_00263800 [Mycena kentingensis (nom. inval.)]|nr:hypothetical protein MKEN_00263800 [Mycena kentingensis (nom. inval.)]